MASAAGIGADTGTGGQGHEGFSGTNMWKMQDQTAQIRKHQQQVIDQLAAQEAEKKMDELEELPLLAHGVSVGVVGKPVVRTVLVKDLRKAAKLLKIPLPTQGVFSGTACGLFALFDGQSCAGEVGPQAAGYCAQQFHLKVLPKLAALAPDRCFDKFVATALSDAFSDLDEELVQRPEGAEGCGACVALVVGQKLFTAVVGKCNVILAETSFKESKDGKLEPDGDPTPIPLGDKQGRCQLPNEQNWIRQRGGNTILSEGKMKVSNGGMTSTVTRSIGDAAWKSSGSDTSMIRNTPEVHTINLDWGVRHPYLLMISTPIAARMTPKLMMDVAEMFPVRPKAMAGEIANVALDITKMEPSSQCTVCALSFLPPSEVDDEIPRGAPSVAPPPKKQKTGPKTESMRLRHILVRHKECKITRDPVRNKDVTRTKAEAETMLRKALKELHESGEDSVDPKKPEKATPKFEKICKEISECQTALKGAGSRGDLGWMSKDQIKNKGKDFELIANTLQMAKWSDIAYSNDGCHIILRML